MLKAGKNRGLAPLGTIATATNYIKSSNKEKDIYFLKLEINNEVEGVSESDYYLFPIPSFMTTDNTPRISGSYYAAQTYQDHFNGKTVVVDLVVTSGMLVLRVGGPVRVL